MFADLDETIRQLLVQRAGLDPNQVDISFETPDREWSSRLTRPAVNCFLYDVRENAEKRKQGWDVRHNGSANDVARKKAPLRIDVTYHVTAWARAPEDEHRLLWIALATLGRYAPLPKEVLQGELAGQPYLPVPAQVAQAENMPANFADLWQALENRIRPSITYTATLALDLNWEITIPPVLFPPRVSAEQLDRRGAEEALRVRGRLRDKQDANGFVAGALVLIQETGARTFTDEEGWFQFEGVPRGPITLIARASGREETSRATSVPSARCDLEI